MPIAHTRDEAQLFHHFTRHLGRWLDCTNAARISTLAVSEKAGECSILGNAVLCFSARHQGKNDQGEEAYERAISLLVDRLSEIPAHFDEMLLSAVLLLHFADQLDSPTHNCPRDKPHLKGTSSILRASMPTPFIDPSASSLRDAAFWVYVRQCLYNSTISQEPLDIDFSLQLLPAPDSLIEPHPLAWLCRETAWANQLLWNTACVANFCFSVPKMRDDAVTRAAAWQELWDRNESWQKDRPKAFDAIGGGPTQDEHVFDDIWFTADWHVISYVFHHFASILLLRYGPKSKFRTQWVRSKLSSTDHEILQHARAICSACKSSMQNAQLLIVLCHTLFIWGPIITSSAERQEIVRMLRTFENMHAWRTAWIVDALKVEWGMD
ncbi:uncharacterized protein M421DRAFT_59001 [Didymella exigua CBS 183.55]|uniref:Transcription factor domain-containing protein n=1 Tax=Didymella exigua CBS 183.55 TaxID=1150837 RepID=A0A6A5RR91_9PLEO|nr:uncharacterized protein M421DRAFT_59001 [Didymella exigua CBS 183.55]KAF1930292.1 hypothetical protein M421DRAFT_59001 [Didymella exigua CBS 183.55]